MPASLLTSVISSAFEKVGIRDIQSLLAGSDINAVPLFLPYLPSGSKC